MSDERRIHPVEMKAFSGSEAQQQTHLARAPEPAPEVESDPADEPTGGAQLPERRALVADDDAGIRILVTRILTRQGYDVDTARDGAEAIEKILQHDYAVIALDLMMPRIDGQGVVKYLVQHRPEALPNIIVMTAFGAGAKGDVCPPVGRFLEKPFDISTFLAEADGCASDAQEPSRPVAVPNPSDDTEPEDSSTDPRARASDSSD